MASKNNFSIGEAVSYGFNRAKKHWGFLIVCVLISIAASMIPNLTASALTDRGNPTIASFIVQIAGWVLQMAVSLGLIGVALRLYDKKRTEFKNLFDYFNLIIPYLIASIIYGVIVVVGLILLIIPGIIWAIKFRYFSYFMVDKNLGPIDALKASSKITKGVKWQLLFFGIVLGLINIVGALLILVGLLFTIPLSIMAEVYVYRKLSGK